MRDEIGWQSSRAPTFEAYSFSLMAVHFSLMAVHGLWSGLQPRCSAQGGAPLASRSSSTSALSDKRETTSFRVPAGGGDLVRVCLMPPPRPRSPPAQFQASARSALGQ